MYELGSKVKLKKQKEKMKNKTNSFPWQLSWCWNIFCMFLIKHVKIALFHFLLKYGNKMPSSVGQNIYPKHQTIVVGKKLENN